MAKKDLFKVCLVAAAVMSASSASAATISGSTVLGGGTYSPSNKVEVNVESSTTAYAAKSGHLSGDRTVFTNSTDPKMYWTTKTVGSSPAKVTGETETVSGWTTL
ncbi:MAG: hypothetical protein AB7I29_03765 [Geobacter sp.]